MARMVYVSWYVLRFCGRMGKSILQKCLLTGRAKGRVLTGLEI
jgi:hypothetical protein